MKIGLSYSRCVRDIVDGVVDIEDVLVLITRTDFNPNVDEEWRGIWIGYGGGNGGAGSIWSRPEWGSYPAEDEQKFRDVSIELYNSGRMHQPRQFGAHPRRMPYIWLESVLPTDELDSNPAVKKAWDNFQTMAGLSGITLDKDAQ
jgi:hypothetical protein